jgi:PAS domain S-box-containing protein
MHRWFGDHSPVEIFTPDSGIQLNSLPAAQQLGSGLCYLYQMFSLLTRFILYFAHLAMSKTVSQIDQKSYNLLLESISDHAIMILDQEGYIINWSRGAEQINGYTESEVLGKHFSIFYTKEDMEKSQPEKNLKKVRDTGGLEYKAWRVRKDGSEYWANIVFTALKNNSGETIGFGKVIHDLSKQVQTEERISLLNKELENRLQQSQSEISDYKHALDESAIVAITDQKGIIKHVNDNFCKISKYSKEELLGQDHRIINSGFHSKEFIRNLWVTIANGKIWRGELRNKAKDATHYWVDTTIVPFLNEQGKPYQYLAIRSDITQRKLAEEQLLKANEDLENKVRERTLELTHALEKEKELNEMKSRFVSMASHEFRTPLSAILSSTSLIEHYLSPEQEEKRKKHVERIKSSVKNLTSILDDFLSLEKLEQGKVESHNSEFNLKEFIEDAIEEMEGMSKKKQQEINFDYDGPEEVYQDKKILRNVLLNLLSNAIKYSPEGKSVYVSAQIINEQVTFKVKDEGIGIPLEAQKNLFDKFFRARNAVNIQGTGLGLNIVKRYVELLDGTISFDSKENAGSCFTVQIPKIKKD